MVPHNIANLIHKVREGRDAGKMEVHAEETHNICELLRRSTYTGAWLGCPQTRRVRANFNRHGARGLGLKKVRKPGSVRAQDGRNGRVPEAYGL